MKWFVIAAALLVPAAALGQVSVDWVQDTEGVSIAVDDVNNVYTAYYEYNPAGDITLTKRDTNGAFLWNAKFDQTSNSAWEKATWVAVDHQGNAIVSGSLMSGYSNPVNAAGILMKFSPSGQLLWRRVYETSFDGSYTKKCLVDDSDNIYVLSFGGPQGPVTKVKKFAPDGSALWIWFDSAGIGAPVNFKFTPDGALTITGRSVYGSINGYAKIDLEGNTIWSQVGINSLTAGDADGDSFGNTYLVHGEYVANGGTVIRKISPAGSLLWANTYPLAGLRVEVGSDDLPVVCGYPNAGTVGSSFVKVDADGGVVWTNPDADGPLALMAHAQLLMDPDDNIYLAAGTMFEMAVCKVTNTGASAWTATTTGSYAYGLSLGSDGNVYVSGGDTARLGQVFVSGLPGVAAGQAQGTALGQNYPNPFHGTTTIRYELPAESQVKLQVFDAAGRAVKVLADGLQGPGARTVQLDADGLPAGVYTYLLHRGSVVEGRKLTVLR